MDFVSIIKFRTLVQLIKRNIFRYGDVVAKPSVDRWRQLLVRCKVPRQGHLTLPNIKGHMSAKL